ncbi:MAG TPA: hypothetical protein VJZ71_00640 [Phycisphaerae bacterium]|nr:hypothetical protein [Phycisphaerae bacterium]
MPPESTAEDEQKAMERERVILREAGTITARTALLWSAVGIAVLIAVIHAMRASLVSADELFHGGGLHWDHALMPSVLFGLLGAAFGALLGWRMTSSSGLTGVLAWRIGAMAIAFFVLAGGVTSLFIFSGTVPVTLWLSLFAMTLAALGTMSIFTTWAA